MICGQNNPKWCLVTFDDCVQPLGVMTQKVMMYPAPSDNERSQHYLTIDPDGPLDESLSPIPYIPTPEEIVQLQDKSLIHHNWT